MYVSSATSQKIPFSEVDSAIKIQSTWRRYRVRKNFLTRDLYLTAKRYLSTSSVDNLPQATSGQTKVFLSNELGVVFKQLGEERSQRRFFAMWEARDVCVKNGYVHLLIPQAHPFGEYNIEQMSPVHNVKQRKQVALYIENQTSFSLAVTEFTSFLCQSNLPDILTNTHPYQTEENLPLGRCDNLPILIDGRIGKIVLIDLGGYRSREKALSPEDAISCFKTAIYIFPHHFDDILRTIASFSPQIREKKIALKKLHKKILNQFKNIYENHRQFIKQKIIYDKLPDLFFFISKKRIQSILHRVQLTIAQNEKMGSLPEEHILISLIKKIIDLISDQLKGNTPEKRNLASYVCSRCITLDVSVLPSLIQDQMMLQFTIKTILNHLKGNEICYYNLYFNRHGKMLTIIHF